jgi:hypothetical protein
MTQNIKTEDWSPMTGPSSSGHPNWEPKPTMQSNLTNHHSGQCGSDIRSEIDRRSESQKRPAADENDGTKFQRLDGGSSGNFRRVSQPKAAPTFNPAASDDGDDDIQFLESVVVVGEVRRRKSNSAFESLIRHQQRIPLLQFLSNPPLFAQSLSQSHSANMMVKLVSSQSQKIFYIYDDTVPHGFFKQVSKLQNLFPVIKGGTTS